MLVRDQTWSWNAWAGPLPGQYDSSEPWRSQLRDEMKHVPEGKLHLPLLSQRACFIPELGWCLAHDIGTTLSGTVSPTLYRGLTLERIHGVRPRAL